MNIAIDISPLQGAHRMRGIGSVVINLINHLPSDVRASHHFTFFVMPPSDGSADPLALLDLNDLSYELRTLREAPRVKRRLPGPFSVVTSAANQSLQVWAHLHGDPRFDEIALEDVDAVVQLDPALALPAAHRHVRLHLTVHDLIPYVAWWDYLWNYRTARSHGMRRRSAARVHFRRYLYVLKLGGNLMRADSVVVNSGTTRVDLEARFPLQRKKIRVVYWGVDHDDEEATQASAPQVAYRRTPWGHLPGPFAIDTSVPFLLFVGGADRRRKLQDLVAAFNALRGRGLGVQLVLAGDTMQGPRAIATEEIQDALLDSSYADDIVFLGFTPPEVLRWLYEHALAFVFPSRYEGFGLPVLEAMAHGCPVISYPNSATLEVAGGAAVFVRDYAELVGAVERTLQMPPEERKAMIASGRARASTFTWERAARQVTDGVTGSGMPTRLLREIGR